jgi:lipopolysaccharide export system permease protein
MPRILDRLILGTFIRLFLGFAVGAPVLFILGDATENLDGYLDRGIPLGDVALSYVYQYPQFLSWTFPIAALLATVFTIHPLTTHREIMAMKSGGISFHRLVLPLLVMGVVLTGVGLVLAEAAPRANQVAVEIRGERARATAFRSNFVYVTDTGESLTGRRLNVGDGRILGVTLQELSGDPAGLVRHVDAEDAVWEEGRGWTFRNGFTREIYPDRTEVTFQFSSARFPGIGERPEELLESYRDEDEMTYAELTQFGNRLLRSGGDVGRTFTKRAQRWAIPAAAFVIILFGAPLATSSKRGGAAFGIGLSLATTILYIMLFRVSGALGYTETLDPRVAAWLPNALFLAAGLVLMQRVRT